MKEEEIKKETKKESREEIVKVNKMVFDKKIKEDEIYEIRQKVYSKLKQGRKVYSLMRMFKWKVERYLRSFRAELSYDEEKKWREKVIITEKAVVKIRNERKATIDAVRAQELLIENLPDPPEDDESEETLRKLKKLDEELVNGKNKVAVEKEMKVKATKVKIKMLANNSCGVQVHSKRNVVKRNGKDDVFDMDELVGKKIVLPNDINADDYRNEVTEGKEKENEPFDNRDEENVDHERLEERKLEKPDDIKPKNLYDKFDHESGSNDVKGMHDDFLYMQVPNEAGKEDELGKTTDVSAIVALLQAIFAILLVIGNTLHEQSLQTARLSRWSQLSQHRHHQSEDTVSPSSEAKETCKFTIAMLSKVTRMYSSAHAGLVWLSQLGRAVNCVKEEMMKTLTNVMVRILIGLDL